MRARSAFAQFMGVFGLVGMIGQLATLATAFSFSRDQERDADRIGIVLMRQAGYDPREASKVWGNLLAELAATPGRDPLMESPLFATHPPSEERRSALETMAAGSTGETGEAALRACLAPLRFGLLDDELKRGHLEESIALLNRMIARESDSAELLYFRGEARRQRAAQGDADLALEDLNAAVRSSGEPAVTHRSLGELYRTLNQPQDARAAWQRYLERAPEAPDAAIVKHALEELKP
jgi:predicted Zn-dependent protease